MTDDEKMERLRRIRHSIPLGAAIRAWAWCSFTFAVSNTAIRVLDYVSETPVLDQQQPGPIVAWLTISMCWWTWYEFKDW